MSESGAKLISTTVIWLAVACISVFGIFSSGIHEFLKFLCLAIVSWAGALSTVTVWRPGKAITHPDVTKGPGVDDLA